MKRKRSLNGNHSLNVGLSLKRRFPDESWKMRSVTRMGVTGDSWPVTPVTLYGKPIQRCLKPIPLPEDVTVMLYLEKDLFDRLQDKADALGTTVEGYVPALVRNELKRWAGMEEAI